MQRFTRLLHYIWPHIKKYPGSFYLTFVGYGVGWIIATLFVPFIYRDLVDILSSDLAPADMAEPLLRLVLILAIAIAAYNVLFRLGDYAIIRFQSLAQRDISSYLFEKLCARSYGFFINRFVGSIVTTTKRFVRAFETMHDKIVYNFWGGIVQLGGMLIVLFLVNQRIALLFLAWVVAFMTMTAALVKKRSSLDLAEARHDSRITGLIADTITNILTIKMFARSKREQQTFNHAAEEQHFARYKSSLFSTHINTAQAVLIGILEVAGMYVAIKLWLGGTISSGTVILIQAYFGSVFNTVWTLGRALSEFSKALSDASEMVEILDIPIDIKDPANPEQVRIKQGHVKINNVSFRYGRDETQVFTDFNLDIPAGQRVGLVGHSGAGKSTITKLLLRFADVTKGSITIDGQDIRNITQDNLRRNISYVPQDPILFHRSLAENIGYGNTRSSIEQTIESAKKAHAHEFISRLPHGYDTLVGERGVKLSGGERQRVTIARAMLKNAPILILDEATSSLDSVSEKYILEAYVELMKNRTTIVIAHRLSTIQKLNRIIVLKEGRIVEEGTHDELIALGGVYFDFWMHQAGGFIE